MKSGVKTVALILLVGMLAGTETGCSREWKKKFVRKNKKTAESPQPVLVMESDVNATHPPEVRYQEHFAYWKSWNGELLDSLGQTRKRDARRLSGVINELQSLQSLLTGPPAEHLRRILVELSDIETALNQSPETGTVLPSLRSRLERIQREVNRDFYYAKIKPWLIGQPSPQKSG